MKTLFAIAAVSAFAASATAGGVSSSLEKYMYATEKSPKVPAASMAEKSGYQEMEKAFKKAASIAPEQLAGDSMKVFEAVSTDSRQPEKLSHETLVFSRICSGKCTEADRSVRMLIASAGVSKTTAREMLKEANTAPVNIELSYTQHGYEGFKRIYSIEVRRMENGGFIYRYMPSYSATSFDGGVIYYGITKKEVK